MAAEVEMNGFESLAKEPAEKVRPASVVPDPNTVTGLDWVVVQIAYTPNGMLTALQELRGWWTGKNYFSVPADKRCRTRVVTMGEQGEVVEFDTSNI